MRTQWDRQPQLPHSLFTCFNKCNVFSHRQNNSLLYSSTLVLHLLSTLNPNPIHPAAWWMSENVKYHRFCRSDFASNLFPFVWLLVFFLLFSPVCGIKHEFCLWTTDKACLASKYESLEMKFWEVPVRRHPCNLSLVSGIYFTK